MRFNEHWKGIRILKVDNNFPRSNFEIDDMVKIHIEISHFFVKLVYCSSFTFVVSQT